MLFCFPFVNFVLTNIELMRNRRFFQTGAQDRSANIGSPVQCMDQGWGTIYIGTKSGHISRYSIKVFIISVLEFFHFVVFFIPPEIFLSAYENLSFLFGVVVDRLNIVASSLFAFSYPSDSIVVSLFVHQSTSLKGDRLEFSDKSVLALKASAEGPRRVLIVASRNQPITIRDANTGLFLRTICGYKNHTVYSLMRDRNLVYCGTSSTSIPVYDFTVRFPLSPFARINVQHRRKLCFENCHQNPTKYRKHRFFKTDRTIASPNLADRGTEG